MLEIFRTPYLFFDIETREPERAISREKPLCFVTLAAALRTFFFQGIGCEQSRRNYGDTM